MRRFDPLLYWTSILLAPDSMEKRDDSEGLEGFHAGFLSKEGKVSQMGLT